MKPPLRTAALVAALLSLGVIGLRPSWRVGATAHDAVLRTPGAGPARPEHLADSLGGAPVFGSLAEVLDHRAGLGQLHVIGWGLDAQDWARVESIPITFHPADLPAGITQARWPVRIVLGERVSVDGVLTGPPARTPALVELTDPTGVVDSAVTDSGGVFHLEAAPRAEGELLYTVRVGGTAIAETLGVQVLTPPAWRVLVLESAPRPETALLRDWLARRNGVIAVRSRVSRNREHTEFVNRSNTSLDVVTGALVAQFDVVIIDGRTLARLGGQERSVLQRAVENDGLGVIIVPDTTVSDVFFTDFALTREGNLDERLVRPVWRGREGREQPAPAVPAEPYTLGDRFGTETLIGDGFGHALVQVAPRGAGRVSLSLITGSARWRRAGLADTYATYWSRLLAATADPQRDAPRWSIATAGPWLVGQPVAIEAASARPLNTALVTNPAGAIDTVYLARDSAGSGRWRGVYWPRVSGWHKVVGDGGPAIYVQTEGSWVGVGASNRRATSFRALVQGASGAHTPTASLAVPPRPVPLGWPFAVFLGAAGFLWSERRRVRPATGS